MNADGTQQIRLPYIGSPCTDPDWSPDGSKISFMCGEMIQDIYVMNADGTGKTRLTNNAGNGMYDISPTWSPDGSKIAYDGNHDIYVMNSDGGVQTLIITHGYDPDWGPATKQPPVTVKVRIVPNSLNTASKGKFVAFITLPTNYKAADVNAKSVMCEGAPALRLIRIKAFPNTFAAIFSRDKLVNVKPGDKVKLTVTGTINKNGQKIGFSGSHLIKVTNKKGNTKEAIDDVERMTDEKVFSQFNPR